jgi:hypothetical protein
MSKKSKKKFIYYFFNTMFLFSFILAIQNVFLFFYWFKPSEPNVKDYLQQYQDGFFNMVSKGVILVFKTVFSHSFKKLFGV